MMMILMRIRQTVVVTIAVMVVVAVMMLEMVVAVENWSQFGTSGVIR